MLLIPGVAALCAGLWLNAIAHLVLATDAPPTPMRRFLAGSAGDSVAVTLIFVGALTLMIFLANVPSSPFQPLPWTVGAVIVAAAVFAIRRTWRQTAEAREATPEPAQASIEEPVIASPAEASSADVTLAEASAVEASPADVSPDQAPPAVPPTATAKPTPPKPKNKKQHRSKRGHRHKHAA